jgi:hypothetical protein
MKKPDAPSRLRGLELPPHLEIEPAGKSLDLFIAFLLLRERRLGTEAEEYQNKHHT